MNRRTTVLAVLTLVFMILFGMAAFAGTGHWMQDVSYNDMMFGWYERNT